MNTRVKILLLYHYTKAIIYLGMDPKEINRHLKDILKEVTEEFELKSKVRCQEEYNSKAAPAYEKHFILKNKYLISYINLFPDAATELLMQEVGPVLHPDLYKGGILIISSKFSLNHGSGNTMKLFCS